MAPELTEESLVSAIRRLAKKSSTKVAKDYGVDEARARTMTAGALIFLEIHRRLTCRYRWGAAASVKVPRSRCSRTWSRLPAPPSVRSRGTA